MIVQIKITFHKTITKIVFFTYSLRLDCHIEKSMQQ